jgi:hypothetical protein
MLKGRGADGTGGREVVIAYMVVVVVVGRGRGGSGGGEQLWRSNVWMVEDGPPIPSHLMPPTHAKAYTKAYTKAHCIPSHLIASHAMPHLISSHLIQPSCHSTIPFRCIPFHFVFTAFYFNSFSLHSISLRFHCISLAHSLHSFFACMYAGHPVSGPVLRALPSSSGSSRWG